jgi:hypothetical protein
VIAIRPASASTIAEIVGAVARQALRDWRKQRIAVLDDGSPAADWCVATLARELGANSVARVTDDASQMESVLRLLGPVADREQLREDWRRLRARVLPDTLLAAPHNKTALLLGGPLPAEPLLPLGDLYASEVAALCGGWSAPREVASLAEAVGGIEVLDAALQRRIDGRDPAGLAPLGNFAARVERELERGRASRLAPRVVPKIGIRTIGVDLFE